MQSTSTSFAAVLDGKAMGKARRLSYEPTIGMLRVQQVYESTDPEIVEELEDIEDMVDGSGEAMCRLLHRLARKEGCDRYEDPVTGFGVYTSDYLLQQDCCGHQCRHCPHSHKNVPRSGSKAKVLHTAKKASAPRRCVPSLPVIATTPSAPGECSGSCSNGSASKADIRSGGKKSKEASAEDRCSRLLQQARAAMRQARGERCSRSSEGTSSSRSSKEAGGGSDGDGDGNSDGDGESDDSFSSDTDHAHDRQSMQPQRSWPVSFTEADLSAAARAEAESQRSEPLGFQRVLHREACRQGYDTYKDPPTGYTVFTARALQPRPCCGNGCRHCPHAHCSVPDYMRAAVSCTALLDDDWDW